MVWSGEQPTGGTLNRQVIRPGRALQAHAADAPVYVAQVIGCSGWAKVMALSIALVAIVLAGLVLMFVARFSLRSDFFRITRETGPREETRVGD